MYSLSEAELILGLTFNVGIKSPSGNMRNPDFWKKDRYDETRCSYRTITESLCGRYYVTGITSKLGGTQAYSDRYIAEHREEGFCLWFSRHRTERAAFAAAEKRARAVARGLKKKRVARTRRDIEIKRKK